MARIGKNYRSSESEVKFTELLNTEGFSVERNSVKEAAYVAKKGTDTGDNTSDNTQGDNTQGGDNQGGGNGQGGLE